QLILPGVRPGQSGEYAVSVVNRAGASTSAVAVVSVKPPPTRVRTANTIGLSQGVLTLPVEIAPQGFERALEFSLGFPPAWLTWRSVSLAAGLPTGSTVAADTTQAVAGRVGLRFVLGGPLEPAATNQLLALVRFAIPVISNEVPLAVSFEDQPQPKRVLDASGQELLASFEAGDIRVSPTRIEVVSVAADGAGCVFMPIRLRALGGEYAFELTLSFPPSSLTFLGASIPFGQAVLVTNMMKAASGLVGISAVGHSLSTPFP